MSSFEPVRFGLIGSGWITRQHELSFRAIPEATVVAAADYPRDRGGRPGRGEAMCKELGLERYYPDFRRMLEASDIEAVTVSLPNSLHAEVTIAALEAGKHVVVEKPLCFTMAEADRIVALSKEKNLVVGYAEELPFCPKFVRGKELVAAGAIGDLFFVKQSEIHAGPYSDWFFDPDLAGGGSVMDMGCHAMEYARWMFDKAKITSVTAQLATYVHGDRGAVDDQCVVHFELEDGRSAVVEAGWTLQGGMESTAHLRGTTGVLNIDLLKGMGMDLFSISGVVEEEILPGWSQQGYEWLWQNGYPQEMAEFARAIREGRTPSESAEDGRAIMEVIWASYASAAEGRTIQLPYTPPADVPHPVQLWIDREAR